MPIPAHLFYSTVIRPGLSALESHPRLERQLALNLGNSPKSSAMLLAIALQESGLQHRLQVSSSTGQEMQHLARGWWQCEPISCRLLLSNPATTWLPKVMADYGLRGTAAVLHDLVRDVDMLAVWAARGLLWCLPQPLPLPLFEQRELAWSQYLAAWNPGKARPEKWPENWRVAVRVVREAYAMAPDPSLSGPARPMPGGSEPQV